MLSMRPVTGIARRKPSNLFFICDGEIRTRRNHYSVFENKIVMNARCKISFPVSWSLSQIMLILTCRGGTLQSLHYVARSQWNRSDLEVSVVLLEIWRKIITLSENMDFFNFMNDELLFCLEIRIYSNEKLLLMQKKITNFCPPKNRVLWG